VRPADLFAAGAIEAPSQAALSAQSSIVFVCVPGSPQVGTVMNAADGLLAIKRQGLAIIDCSTGEPGATARLREQAAAVGPTLVDAPLAGTPAPAVIGDAAHQSLALACALGYGWHFVPGRRPGAAAPAPGGYPMARRRPMLPASVRR
jgi:hypothetical protein